jgi:nucleotide-binding universal stress UspA family protein
MPAKGGTMISKILVAVDGSAHSMKAVDYASEIGNGLGAELILLYVAKFDRALKAMSEMARVEKLPNREPDMLEILKRGGSAVLEKAAERAKSAGVSKVHIEVEEGPVARTIVARAKHHDVDLIVVGSRGMGDVEGLLRGGVSHRVEILAKCPVMVVK